MEYRVFLDTNIFVDHFQDRNPYSTQILKYCEDGELTGYASSASFYTIAYLAQKVLTQKRSRELLNAYLTFIVVIPTTFENLTASISSGFSDLEDAFQYFTALNKSGNFFITNNIKDYHKNTLSQLPVVSAEHFINEVMK